MLSSPIFSSFALLPAPNAQVFCLSPQVITHCNGLSRQAWVYCTQVSAPCKSQEGGDFPPSPMGSFGCSNNEIDTRQINRRKNNLICMHRGLIEMGLPKWPNQDVYISFLDQEIIICEALTKGQQCLGLQTNEEVTKFVYTAFLALNSLTLVIRMLSILSVQRGYLHMGDLFTTFRGKEGSQSVFLCHFFPHWLFLK